MCLTMSVSMNPGSKMVIGCNSACMRDLEDEKVGCCNRYGFAKYRCLNTSTGSTMFCEKPYSDY